ncbi:MAG: hypothetical protein AB8F74_01125, partial [Saprospiraceae bacterium]
RETTFDEGYMGVEQPSSLSGESEQNSAHSSPTYYLYFLSSLSPADRLLFEVKYVQRFENRKGYFYIFQFLLNSNKIGNENLMEFLEKNKVLDEPLISSFILKKAKAAFLTGKKEQSEENLVSILQVLKNKPEEEKERFKSICHKTEVHVNRVFGDFKKDIKEKKELTALEKAFYFANKYLVLEEPIELWLRLNLDAKRDKHLATELAQVKLGDKDDFILEKHKSLRKKAILARTKTGKKEEKRISETIADIQNEINLKLNKSISWKTN